MTQPKAPRKRGRQSGGAWTESEKRSSAARRPKGEKTPKKEPERYERVPPEERRRGKRKTNVAPVVKTIIVKDEQGQLVSVTKVATDAKFGVGVMPSPGHTVTELEAGTLAEDLFPIDRD